MDDDTHQSAGLGEGDPARPPSAPRGETPRRRIPSPPPPPDPYQSDGGPKRTPTHTQATEASDPSMMVAAAAGVPALPASQPMTSSLPISSPILPPGLHPIPAVPPAAIEVDTTTPQTPSPSDGVAASPVDSLAYPLPSVALPANGSPASSMRQFVRGGSNTYGGTASPSDADNDSLGTPLSPPDLFHKRVSLPRLPSTELSFPSPAPRALAALLGASAQHGDHVRIFPPAYVPKSLGTLVSPAPRNFSSAYRRQPPSPHDALSLASSSSAAIVHLAAPFASPPQASSRTTFVQYGAPSPSATGLPSISTRHVTVAAPSPLVPSNSTSKISPTSGQQQQQSSSSLLPRPKPRLAAPVGPGGSPSANSASGAQKTFPGPVFKPDGDIDQRYVNQQHVLRKRRVADMLLAFAVIYLVLEVPYIVNAHWTISRNYLPIVLRFLLSCLIYAAVVVNRRLYVARFITHTTDRFDGLVCALMICASVLLCVAENQRQLRTDVTLDATTGQPTAVHLSAVDPIMADGLLLGLCLISAFAAGVARIRWPFLGLHGLLSMGVYLLTTLVEDFQSTRQILLGLAFQALLLTMFLGVSWRTERAKQAVLTQQKFQFLERKKAEKLLRSMLPMRILSDYLDGSIGQLQANATIGFMQLHLGALTEETGPPGSHQPSSPQAIASPGELMQKLHDTFKRIDGIVSMYAIRGVTKIETVATTYLLCAGLLQDIDDHAAAMIDVSLEILAMVTTRLNIGGAAKRIPVMMRIGISSGPVVGGIIGDQRRFFRVFGDTVNVAARMCTNVRMGCIQISPSCYAALNERQRAAYVIPPGTNLNIKGKGEMMCYRIESRADWVAKFNKITMNRGQQDRDEPLLNKSFVYHKLMARTDITPWMLQYHQEEGALRSLQKQVTFVREARSASNAATHGSMHKLTRPASAHVGSGAVGGVSPQMATASRLSRGTSAKTKAPPGTATTATGTGSVHGPVTTATDGTAPGGGGRPTSALVRLATFASGSRKHTSKALSADVSATGTNTGAGGKSPTNGGGGGGKSPLGGDTSLQVYTATMTANTKSSAAPAAPPRSLSVDSIDTTAANPNNSEPSPFSAEQIERFFQLSFAREYVGDIRACTGLLGVFELALLIYLVVHHPHSADPAQAWDTSSGRNTSPAIMVACLLALFVVYDLLSVVQDALRLLFPASDDEDDDDAGGLAEETCDPAGQASSPSPTSAAVAAATRPAHHRGSTATSVDERQVTHFTRHLQTYTAVFCLLCHVWVLVGLQLWRVDDDSQVHPVFAMLLVTFFSAFALRLQFRLLVPMAFLTWLIFAILLLVDRFFFTHILLILLNLFAGLLISGGVLYAFERSLRQNFLLAYALEKEQEYMDQFLNNLLPKDVVLVLKKQNPAGLKEGGGGGGTSTAGGGLRGVHSRLHSRLHSQHQSTASRTSLTAAMATGKSPHHTSRPSNSGGGGRLGGGGGGGAPAPVSMSLGEGGVASRFAMHFPRTTVFESDIVGYTQMVSSLSPSDTLNLLNLIFSRFDKVAHEMGVEKIETIGDAFMCMVFDGQPDPVLDFALQIVGVLRSCSLETQPHQDLQIRMGICTGSCFGGIVGTEIPRFHLFGQAHDVAIHIEQNGRAGDIIVSSSTAALSSSRYVYEPLDLVVDEMATFLLKSKRPYDEEDDEAPDAAEGEPDDSQENYPGSCDLGSDGVSIQQQASQKKPQPPQQQRPVGHHHFVSILPECETPTPPMMTPTPPTTTGAPGGGSGGRELPNQTPPFPSIKHSPNSVICSPLDGGGGGGRGSGGIDGLELARLNLQHVPSSSIGTPVKRSPASVTLPAAGSAASSFISDGVGLGTSSGSASGSPAVGGGSSSHRTTGSSGSNGSYVSSALNPNHSIHTSASAVASSSRAEMHVVQQDQFVNPDLV